MEIRAGQEARRSPRDRDAHFPTALIPQLDTLVAQHLIKTLSAARLMGADCIIIGIRPQIAQTIVHLGLQLDVVSKATMVDAFALALKRQRGDAGHCRLDPYASRGREAVECPSKFML